MDESASVRKAFKEIAALREEVENFATNFYLITEKLKELEGRIEKLEGDD